MNYTSGRAFRQALETRLRDIQRSENIPMVRLRKQIAFERFIARLQAIQSDTWILKGGLAMQLRLGGQSRTTMDIDLLCVGLGSRVHDKLVAAAEMELGDWFKFVVGQANEEPEDDFGGYRYQVLSQVDGRVFEQFHVDVGVADLLTDDYDILRFDSILDFAGITATSVPCYPITHQIAEKFHALTRKYSSGSSTRGKDFVDILLLAGLCRIDGTLLARAIVSTFDLRDTHPIPQTMPALQQTLRREYTRIADEVGLIFKDLDSAESALKAFINPVLQGDHQGNWNAEKWVWE